MSSFKPFHTVDSFTVKPGQLQEFQNVVKPFIRELEKTECHVDYIFTLHKETVKGLDKVLLIAKFFTKDAMDRVRASPPFVQMSKAIEPLLEEPSELTYGHAVLGFDTRVR